MATGLLSVGNRPMACWNDLSLATDCHRRRQEVRAGRALRVALKLAGIGLAPCGHRPLDPPLRRANIRSGRSRLTGC